MIKDLVMMMYQNNRIKELLEILEQESPYSTDSIENIPKTKEDKELFILAINHLRFVVKFGIKDSTNLLVDNQNSYISFQNEFHKWLDNGCKGVELDEIINYLKENPIV